MRFSQFLFYFFFYHTRLLSLCVFCLGCFVLPEEDWRGVIRGCWSPEHYWSSPRNDGTLPSVFTIRDGISSPYWHEEIRTPWIVGEIHTWKSLKDSICQGSSEIQHDCWQGERVTEVCQFAGASCGLEPTSSAKVTFHLSCLSFII